MPIAILKYRLPEEQCEFDQVQMAQKYAGALSSFAGYLREQEKYASKPASLHEVRDEFLRICEEHGFDPVTGLP